MSIDPIRYAFVTLLTSDAYLPGALTIAAALKDVHRPLPLDESVAYETVCLVTPDIVDVTTIRLLRKAFDVVVGVEMIVPPDTESLTLLGASSFLAFCAPRVPTQGRNRPFPRGSSIHSPTCVFPASGP